MLRARSRSVDDDRLRKLSSTARDFIKAVRKRNALTFFLNYENAIQKRFTVALQQLFCFSLPPRLPGAARGAIRAGREYS
ncbi:hypothetical protein ACLOJK_030398 [Asimina triloba]